jgi:hypothetical protein
MEVIRETVTGIVNVPEKKKKSTPVTKVFAESTIVRFLSDKLWKTFATTNELYQICSE